MRSHLLVSGSRPELFAMAMSGQADALLIDLHDSVADARKGDARAAVARFLREQGPDSGKTLIVRVNPLSSLHFEADLAAVGGAAPAMLALPRIESQEEIFHVVRALELIEHERGQAAPIPLLPIISTLRGLRCAADVAHAHPRVAGLQLSLAEPLEALGIGREQADVVLRLRLDLRQAAAEAGIPAYDAAWPDITDDNACLHDAQEARRLGFSGKSCIHPSQLGLANAVFSPAQEDILQALKVLEAAALAAQKGQGAVSVDGRNVDGPAIRRADELIQLALRLGILQG